MACNPRHCTRKTHGARTPCQWRREVPHKGPPREDLGHLALRRALRGPAATDGGAATDALVCQFSSLGSLTAEWLAEYAEPGAVAAMDSRQF